MERIRIERIPFSDTFAFRVWAGDNLAGLFMQEDQARRALAILKRLVAGETLYPSGFPAAEAVKQYMAGTRKRLPGRRLRYGTDFIGIPIVRDGKQAWKVDIAPEDIRRLCAATGNRWEWRLIAGSPWLFVGKGRNIHAVLGPEEGNVVGLIVTAARSADA